MNIPVIAFVEFPKIARLSREIIVTEKLDGTNAQVYIPELVETPCVCGHMRGMHNDSIASDGVELCRMWPNDKPCACSVFEPKDVIYAGSRTRWITPEDDNYGFARWVEGNKEELLKLGPGSHFGEWWGQGIQRGYGLKEKRFSLFNVSRWGPGGKEEAMKPACCYTVPVLHRGAFQMEAIDAAITRLVREGSVAAPGFMNPEGVVAFHTAGGHLYKKTIEKDHLPKGAR